MIRINLRDRLRELVERTRANDHPSVFPAMLEGADDEDPSRMVGQPEQWEVHGHWQLGYARRLGLQPGDRLLDVGCGPLRFGLRAIPYLEEGRYTGCDVSEAAIETAMELVQEGGLDGKRPTLICNKGHGIYANRGFDVVWAQSVLTHVPPDEVEAFLAMVDNNLDQEGWAMVTFDAADAIEEDRKGTGYRYPLPWLDERLPDRLSIEEVDRAAGHPRGQHVLLLAARGADLLPPRGARAGSPSSQARAGRR